MRYLDKVFQSGANGENCCPLNNMVQVDTQIEMHTIPSKHATQRFRLTPVDCEASLRQTKIVSLSLFSPPPI